MAGYWPISILSYDQCRDKFALLCVKVLTRKAVCYCNMAVRLFPAPLVQMLTILIQDFPLRGRVVVVHLDMGTMGAVCLMEMEHNQLVR